MRAGQRILIFYFVGNVSEALVDDSMDADKETLNLAV